jgi:biotin carboxyl carrier protein
VKKNESVKSGQTLVILEAMKMEHKVTAPSDGNVKEVLIAVGDQVESGSTLVILED